jgi:hypothetical protein
MAMLAGYYMVYVLTEVDVMWLIATTFDRLLAQLWPSLVLAAFFVADAHDHRPTSTRGGDLPPSPASSPGGQESI